MIKLFNQWQTLFKIVKILNSQATILSNSLIVQFTSTFLNQLKQSLLQETLKLHCFGKNLNPDEYIQLIFDSQQCDFYFDSEYFNFDIVLYN